MIKVLNLYAGLGGNRLNWQDVEVTAVERSPKIAKVYQEYHPEDTVLLEDAHDYLEKHYDEFDFIWSSPPCQSHSKMARANSRTSKKYPDLALYQEILFLQTFHKGKWVVENVVPYYEPLVKPTRKVGRHLFWSNFEFDAEDVARPPGFINKGNAEGRAELMEWLGIFYDGNLYYENNHCAAQVLRNCVHPDLGSQIFEQAFT